MGRLEGKVAIVTGSARGQGEAEARLFVEEGARVVGVDILGDLGQKVVDDLGEQAVFCCEDVSEEGAWPRIVAQAERSFGQVDVLINNAAELMLESLEATSLDRYLRIVAVNQVGVFLGLRAVAPVMRAGGGGSIVNVSSIDGMAGMNGVGAYASTKFAVRGLTKVAALELGKDGIRVNALVPGSVNTAMQGSSDLSDQERNAFFAHQAIPRIGQPEELARAALFLASDESSYMTGSELVVDGGHLAGVRVPGVPGF